MTRALLSCVVLTLATSFVLPATALATVIHVPGDQPTVQAGIDAAVPGDTVLVAPGTYLERIDFHGKAIAVQSSAGAAATILDGQHGGSVVTFVSGEGSGSILDGFTITNGSGSEDLLLRFGGGIRCGSSLVASCSPTIRNNVVTGNAADLGGGISCYNASAPTIDDNVIVSNTAQQKGAGILCQAGCAPSIRRNAITDNACSLGEGGGIACRLGSPALIEGNTIARNQAGFDRSGGGIYLAGSNATIAGNAFEANATTWYGGALACDTSSPQVTGNTFSGNVARYGGAIHVDSRSAPDIVDNLFTGNQANQTGGAISCKDTDANNLRPRISGNVFTSNSAGVGGAVNCENSAAIVDGNEFRGNAASTGGGMATANCAAVISNNRFVQNSSYTGGGLECLAATGADQQATVTANVFQANTATTVGGGARVVTSAPLFTNNVFFANSAELGGAISCDFDTGARFVNDTLFGNEATDRAGGFGYYSCAAHVTNAIMRGNSRGQLGGTGTKPVVSYSDVEGGYAGSANIDADPQFVDAAGGDLHLLAGSPCSGAGDPGASGAPAVDFEGDPRSAVDIGADEFHRHLYFTGDTAPGSTVTIKILGEPLSSPAVLIIGSGVLEPPLTSPFGDWYLAFPIFPVPLGAMPPAGLIAVAATIPPSLPPGLVIPQQAFVKDRLTNLSRIEIE